MVHWFLVSKVEQLGAVLSPDPLWESDLFFLFESL